MSKVFSKDEVLQSCLQYFDNDGLASSVFISKYALKNNDGNFLEKNPNDTFDRLAKEFARIESKYPNPLDLHTIRSLINDFKYIVLQGSPMSAVGNYEQIQSTSNCFVEGTKVHTTVGVKNIEDVKIGDFVVTHKNRTQRVAQIHKNSLNERSIISFKCYRTPKIKVTNNHQFMSISKEQLKWGQKPQFNSIEYLRVGDFIQIPNDESLGNVTDFNISDLFEDVFEYGDKQYEVERVNDKIRLVTLSKSTNSKYPHSMFIPQVINVDEDFAYFIGLWYGDGCIFGENTKKSFSNDRDRKSKVCSSIRGITFTFGAHEEKLTSFVTKYLNKLDIGFDLNENSYIDGTVQIVVHSPILGYSFEKLFGRRFDGKRLHESMHKWPSDLVKSLARGLIDSDGTITKSGDIRVVMNNKSFIKEMYHLLRSKNCLVGYSEVEDRTTARLDFGRNDFFRNASNKTYSDSRINDELSENTMHSIVIDGNTFVQILEKNILDEKPEFVYTLGIEEDHSYSVEGLICLNCFVIEPPYDSYGGILKTDQELVQISKRRGGVGTDLSTIRPKGLPTKNAAKTTDGIAVFMERYSNSCREVAQCIAAGERVLTKRGLIQIQNIIPNEDYAWTKNGWVRIVKLINKGTQTVYNIITKSGYSIKTTKEHIFQTFDKNGNLTETRLKDMIIGENSDIVLCIGEGSERTSLVKLQNNDYKNVNFKPNNCKLPEYLDENLAYILGYSYGDGYSDRNRILEFACSNDYPEIKEKIANYIKTIFDYDVKITKGDGDLENLSIHNKTIVQFLMYNELLKQKSGNLIFPQKIIDSNKSVQMAFLSGYFDADGYASGKKKGYCFASIDNDFIKEVQNILLSNGVLSKIHKESRRDIGYKDLYSLCVVGKTSQDKFVQLMKFSCKVEECLFVSKRDCWITPFKAKTFDIKYNNFDYCPDNDHFLSLSTVIKLKNDKQNVITNLVQDCIVKIEECDEAETYDIELESEHLFWCEGFYVHNSGRRGALMLTLSVHHPEVETFINIKRDLTKVTGANISVRLSDEFMNAVLLDEEYEQKWPVNSENPVVSRKVKAREIWNQIIDSAWTSAEPGLLYWDTILRNGPANIYEDFRSTSTNPSLRKGTMILTDKGPVSIEKLEDQDFYVYNLRNSYSKATCRLSGKNKQLFEVKLSTGFSYFATKEHKWATNSGQKTTIELKSGDKLPILKKKNIFNGHLGDSDDGFLIGWFLGDGWKTLRSDTGNVQYGFIVSEKDFENGIADKLLNILKNKVQFTGEWCKRNRGGKNWYEINTVNKKIDDFMNTFYNPCKNIGLDKKLLEEGSEDFINGLINGYFSSDGSIDNKRNKITFVSKKQKLLSDISEILGFYGIRTSLKKTFTKKHSFPNKKTYNRIYERNDLYISDIESIKHFRDVFDISSIYKKEKLYNLKESKVKILKNYVSVKEVIQTDIYEDVWDITVYDEDNCFSLSHCITHNCSELDLCPDDSCRLALLNLFSYVINPFTENAYFDFNLFHEHSRVAQRLMDDLIDIEIESIDRILDKIQKDPEPDSIKAVEIDLWKRIKKKAFNGRRTGLGITGLGDCLAALGVTYGSPESIDITEQIYKSLGQSAHEESINLAKERGAFPAFNYELEKDHEYLNRLIKDKLKNDWKQYGRRNISLTTTAPVGSMSILTKTTSGIEPVFMLSYKRRKKITSDSEKVDFVDQVGDRWQEFDVYHHAYKKWMDLNPDKIFTESPYYKATAMDIDWVQSVKIQAAAQRWVDHSISKTCNLPNNATKELVSEVYLTAWKHGCKGFTVYRDGCRTGVLVSKEQIEDNMQKFAQNDAFKRPEDVSCTINHVNVKGEKWVVIIGEVDGSPYEIFGGKAEKIQFPSKYKSGVLKKNKSKSNSKYSLIIQDEDEQFVINDIVQTFDNVEYALHTRLLSLALRHGTPVKYVCEQLLKDENSSIFDFSKVIARVLKKYIKDGESSQKCEKCSGKLSFEEGCLTCKSCGYSKCG